MIRLIAGLGNPGPDYAQTRHNAGFWFVDALAERLNVRLAPERSYSGLAAKANVGGQAVWLLEPTTFMNVSGKAVAALARFFKIEPGEILVVHDELDLMPGQAKAQVRRLAGRAQRPEGHPRPNRQRRLLAPAARHRPPGREGAGDRLRAQAPVGRASHRDRQEHRAVALRHRPGAGRRHGEGDDEDQRPATTAEGRKRRSRRPSRCRPNRRRRHDHEARRRFPRSSQAPRSQPPHRPRPTRSTAAATNTRGCPAPPAGSSTRATPPPRAGAPRRATWCCASSGSANRWPASAAPKRLRYARRAPPASAPPSPCPRVVATCEEAVEGEAAGRWRCRRWRLHRQGAQGSHRGLLKRRRLSP